MNTFASCVTNEPVMITGIYHSEDLSEYLQENSLMRRILQKLVRTEKIGLVPRIHDVPVDNLIWAALRYLYMSYFRHFMGEELNDFLIRQISNDSRNPIRKLLLDFVHADLEIKSSEKVRQLFHEYTKEVI